MQAARKQREKGGILRNSHCAPPRLCAEELPPLLPLAARLLGCSPRAREALVTPKRATLEIKEALRLLLLLLLLSIRTCGLQDVTHDGDVDALERGRRDGEATIEAAEEGLGVLTEVLRKGRQHRDEAFHFVVAEGLENKSPLRATAKGKEG